MSSPYRVAPPCSSSRRSAFDASRPVAAWPGRRTAHSSRRDRSCEPQGPLRTWIPPLRRAIWKLRLRLAARGAVLVPSRDDVPGLHVALALEGDGAAVLA